MLKSSVKATNYHRKMIISYICLLTFLIHKANACLDDNEFDYIIVGAGTTGSVIATRLSEDSNAKVLLLEAGGDPSPLADIPLISSQVLGSPMDWNHYSEPQKNCCEMFKDNRVPLSHGKSLGGGSAINFMVYTRGNKENYNSWGKLNPGWSYNDVFPYFEKLEDYEIATSRCDKPYHHKGGPMTVSQPKFQTPMANAFLEAAAELGQPLVDFNARDQIGFMAPPPFTTKNGERCSTYRCYLKPVLDRPNLKVIIDALVTQIHINENKEATGVNYENANATCTAKAKKEVIVSAGAFLTPQLLMLSGIGPRQTLEKYQIPVKVDLPGVGQNFQDHVTAGSLIYRINQTITYSTQTYANKNYLDLWMKTKTGPMTVPEGIEGTAFFSTKYTSQKNNPDIEITFSASNVGGFLKKDMKPEIAALIPSNNDSIISFVPLLLNPKSRGLVTIGSSNPHDPPIVDPKYLSHPGDIDVLVEGVKLGLEIVNTKAFQQYGAQPVISSLPQCEKAKAVNEDEYLKCAVNIFSLAIHHACCTSKMAPRTDLMAVVDHRLRVHQMKRLRVADASIMPSIVSAHTNVPCMVIGEKAADMIKADHKM